jgi:hypothetical protein
MNMGKQLEMFSSKEAVLELVPEYEKKLKAWEYIHLSPDAREKRIKELMPYGNHYPSPDRASIALNNKAGFPLFEPHFQHEEVNPRKEEDLMEYYKDILDEHGELLPSRNQSKAA